MSGNFRKKRMPVREDYTLTKRVLEEVEVAGSSRRTEAPLREKLQQLKQSQAER